MVENLPANAGDTGSIPGWGAKIPHASGPKKQNIKQKQYCNKFNKDFKNGPHQKKSLNKFLMYVHLPRSFFQRNSHLQFPGEHIFAGGGRSGSGATDQPTTNGHNNSCLLELL